VTFTLTTTEVQDVVNVTAKVPLVLFVDRTVKVAELFPEIVVVAGLTVKLLTVEVVTVVMPEDPLKEIVMLPVVPPFFLIDRAETLDVTAHPPVPVPVMDPLVTVPPVPSQSAELLWITVPFTTALL
jgi:hypothetical protein